MVQPKIPKGLGVSFVGCLEYLLGLNYIECIHDTHNFLTLIDFGGRAIKAIMNQKIYIVCFKTLDIP